ncbi:MAG: hypothetical protein H6622_09870 [Halobacteriovoraceae bacterium]|nr:hypothetical protein [Halobacteriovoraceae bacterium]
MVTKIKFLILLVLISLNIYSSTDVCEQKFLIKKGTLKNVAALMPPNRKYFVLENLIRVVSQDSELIVNIFANYDKELNEFNVKSKTQEIIKIVNILNQNKIHHLFLGLIDKEDIVKFIEKNKHQATKHIPLEDVGLATAQKDIFSSDLVWELDRKGLLPPFVSMWELQTYSLVIEQIKNIADVFEKNKLVAKNLGLVVNEDGIVMISNIENIYFDENMQKQSNTLIFINEIKKVSSSWHQAVFERMFPNALYKDVILD